MRVLVLGAGAIGGYFGVRLVQAGVDVTFLVREPRQAVLRERGLSVASSSGNFSCPVKTCTTVSGEGAFDLIVLSCKAYDLDSAIEAVRPAVSGATVVLPVLNGVAHLGVLDSAFGAERVLGGYCYIAATVDVDGTIFHLNERAMLAFGARSDGQKAMVRRIAERFATASFDVNVSDHILDEMWEKYVFITTMAGMTCLTNGSVGDVMETPYGKALTLELLDICCTVARTQGRTLSESWWNSTVATITEEGSFLTSSMMRDRNNGFRTEHEHIFGYMLRLLKENADLIGSQGAGLLTALLTQMQVYDLQRIRGL